MTGASGACYSVRLLEVLLAAGCDVHLTISAAAALVLKQELGLEVALDDFDPVMLRLASSDKFHYHHYSDLLAPIASGSLPTDGMAVCPCSCGTLGAIANGMSTNLILRAAEVHLKERRTLVLVPRETPLSLTHIRNMKLAAESGAVILPAMPAFYHGPKQIGDLIDFVVSRICDQLGVANTLIKRWNERDSGFGTRDSG